MRNHIIVYWFRVVLNRPCTLVGIPYPLFKWWIVFRAFITGGADVLYNKFNVTSSVPPDNPPNNTNSDYRCVVATRTGDWRISRCWDKYRVVCQSGNYIHVNGVYHAIHMIQNLPGANKLQHVCNFTVVYDCHWRTEQKNASLSCNNDKERR